MGTSHRIVSPRRHGCAGAVAIGLAVMVLGASHAAIAAPDRQDGPGPDAIAARPRLPVVMAQAGSMGGTVGPAVSGKRGKSISGGEPQAVAPAPDHRPPPRSVRKRPPARSAVARTPRCPNIVGIWNSWASGLFGRSDTTISRDGSAIHRSGINGSWWCESGRLMMSWGGQPAKAFTLSDDGRRLVGPDGRVGFSRGERS